MDNRVLFNIGYGLYVLTAQEGNQDNGCIINTVMQVTSDPCQIAIAVNKRNYTNQMIQNTKKFNISVLSENAKFDTFKHFGFQSGRDVDKFAEMKLTELPSKNIKAPGIAESPVNIECRVKKIMPLGSHDMFLAEVVGVTVDDKYMDEKGKFNLNRSGLIAYSHGEYFELGKKIGKFGYSVQKPGRKKKKRG